MTKLRVTLRPFSNRLPVKRSPMGLRGSALSMVKATWPTADKDRRQWAAVWASVEAFRSP